VTDEQLKPGADEPTPELPESGADLEPQSQPLAHDEPVEAHTAVPKGSAERAIEGDAQAEGREQAAAHAAAGEHDMGTLPGEHVDEHDSAHGHGHEEARLGPIDWGAWAYVIGGAAVALLLVWAFWVAAF
jgi:hypothetical protein